MSSTSKAWTVAASIGAVEALKDQLGFCRWNYILRSAHHYAKSNVRSISSQAKTLPPNSSAAAAMTSGESLKQAQNSEESLRKVMYLSLAVGAVEAMKDQGLCRWNYAIRSIHQHAKNKIRSSSISQQQASQGIGGARKMVEQEKATRAEESLKTVMYLSCWGPYN
ncbi:unnamed protein product [Linum tenue]|uniref:Wound-responsive family protein n=1 Tax=Linum tenue TaxID=586396 RepID=A0AAV0QYW3_9ROSI|nr:unnamed protein product [Linum tenue]